jgi:hypothetical protein
VAAAGSGGDTSSPEEGGTGGISSDDGGGPAETGGAAGGDGGVDIPTFDGGGGAAAGMMSLFNGTTLDGWDGIPGIWSVKDGAIDGASNTADKFPGTFLSSAGDFSDFRLILMERVVQSNDHLGICIWGSRLAPGSGGAGKCLVVIPPDGSMWDYGKGAIHGAKVGSAGVDSHTWHQVEILANRAKGTIIAAANGVQITKYQDPDPTRLKNGPIRLQLHAWTGPQEVQYKDIVIEVNPTVDKLITLK